METAEGYYQQGLLYEKSDPKKAIENYKKATELDERFLAAYYDWGKVLFESKKYNEAIKKFERCVEIDPRYKLAYHALGRSYEIDNPKKAVGYYRKATEIDKEYVDAYNAWGNVLLDMEKYEEAREKYLKCIEIDSDFKFAYYNLGRSYEKEDPEKAIEFYKKATEIDKKYLGAYNSWGNLLLDQERYGEAREKYLKCLEIDPSYKFAFYNLGRSYEKENPKKALEYYSKAVQIDSSYLDAYNNWGNVLLDMEKLEEARDKYQKCIELKKDYKWAYFNLGRSYEKENPEEAIEFYKKATEIDKEYLGAYNSWGNLLLDQERYGEAREKYLKCLEIDPSYKFAYYNLGRSYEKENPEKSIPYYENMVEINAEDFDAYYNIYYSITLLKDNEEYIQKLEKLIKEKNTAQGFHVLGILYQYYLKDYENSLIHYERSKALGESGDLCLDLSNVYDSRGNLEKALEVLDDALKQDSKNIYTKHNKAHFLFKMGNYKESRVLWQEVLTQYENALL